jgi:hypothetical protein
MTKVVFCFAGTGDDGEGYAFHMEDNCFFYDEILRIYLRGCQHKDVGGGCLSDAGRGYLFPDLYKVAAKIKNAFSKNQFDLLKLEQELGDGICWIGGPQELQKIDVESICLQGFSRGAVLAFISALTLNDLGIPIDIIANQPVPGELFGSTCAKLKKLEKCHNIRTATTLLGSYNLENGVFENQFYQQMVVKFHSNTQVNNWIMPYQSHLEWMKHSLISAHIQRQFAYGGYAKLKWTSSEIRRLYKYATTLYFTPPEFSQKIFGNDGSIPIDKDPIYLDLIKQDATILLHYFQIRHEAISDDQANALVALSKIGLNLDALRPLVQLLVAKNAVAKKFALIVNKVDSICEYLGNVTRSEEDSTKSEKILEHAPYTRKVLFLRAMIFCLKKNHQKKIF